MFYKEKDDNWTRGYRVAIPEVGVFTEENKEDIQWVEEQEKD